MSRATELLTTAEEAATHLRSAEAAKWLDQLDGIYSECEWALGWLIDHDRTDEALRLALALVDFWQFADRIGDGRDWLDRVLLARSVEDASHAEALFQAGLLAFWQGDDAVARDLHQRSLEIASRLSDPTGVALALTGLARIELRTDIGRAQALSLEALDAVSRTNDQRGRSNALHLLGAAAQMTADFPEARDWMLRRLELAHAMGDLRTVAAESGNLSMVERQLGNLTRARELADHALQLADRLGDSWMIPYCLNGLAAIALATGHHERAATLLSAADHLVRDQGAAWPPDEAPHFEHTRTTTAQALSPKTFNQAWSTGHSLTPTEAVTYALSPLEGESALVPEPGRG